MIELKLSVAEIVGPVNMKRINKIARMELFSDWRRARRYARTGVTLSRDLIKSEISGQVPVASAQTLKSARWVARNGGK